MNYLNENIIRDLIQTALLEQSGEEVIDALEQTTDEKTTNQELTNNKRLRADLLDKKIIQMRERISKLQSRIKEIEEEVRNLRNPN
jgi:predicted  nucleic acid-binding Zn-ribbon protein